MLGVVLVGLLLFLPAGTIHWPGGWLLMAVLFAPMFGAGLVMMAKNPSLLEHRLNAKEKEAEQGMIVKFSGLMFLGGFIVAGLDFRNGWFPLPPCGFCGGRRKARWRAARAHTQRFRCFCACLRTRR